MAKKDSVEDQFDQVFDVMPGAESVSYTHLTLPTSYAV